MTGHRHFTQFYESAKQHLEENIPIAYHAHNIMKDRIKVHQFGEALFPELLNGTPEDLYHTMTEDEFKRLTNAYKKRENQIMKVADTTRNFTYKWHDLNIILECFAISQPPKTRTTRLWKSGSSNRK